ncbi:TPA: hypothetical protein HA281_06195 [Candidatus Woesearchaeota archaeon]|nr:hypothetical protein [Candidatus Woesearchaeota archaeon]HIH05542.1 hypothetical protein [Candidatus Woesearchaeota archaeon]HIH92362.1 hypothetical protein [Candidatus Woesearchaeota archaeon]HII65092.1 hypothetical protein [Candidatus Woesearchaeota archaeon]HII65917.1 hypothetical protein [Candidatus Woesearchaeota archaeon]
MKHLGASQTYQIKGVDYVPLIGAIPHFRRNMDYYQANPASPRINDWTQYHYHTLMITLIAGLASYPAIGPTLERILQ